MPRPKRNEAEEAAYQKRMMNKLKKGKGLFDPDSEESKAVAALRNALQGYNLKLRNPKASDKCNELKTAMYNMNNELRFPSKLEKLQGLSDFLSADAGDDKTHYEKLVESGEAFSMNSLFGASKAQIDLALKALSETLELGFEVGDFSKARAEQLKAEEIAREEEAQKKTAEEWIEEFRNDPIVERDGKPSTEWLENIMAVRSLADSRRHSGASLKGEKFSLEEIDHRRYKLWDEGPFRSFVNHLQDNEAAYELASKCAFHGHGGRLDDMMTTYVMNVDSDYKSVGKGLMARYNPTAKAQIELYQKGLKQLNAVKDEGNELQQLRNREKRIQALAEIIGCRNAVNAERGNLLGGDERLNQKLNLANYHKEVRFANSMLDMMSDEKVDALSKLAEKGHGGKMQLAFQAETDRMLEKMNSAKQAEIKSTIEKSVPQEQESGLSMK